MKDRPIGPFPTTSQVIDNGRFEAICIVLALAILLTAPSQVSAEDGANAVLGRWYTDTKEAQIEIVKEVRPRRATAFHGVFIWFENPVYDDDDPEAGLTQRDRNNPDPARRNDPLLGLQFIKNFKYDARRDMWKGGTIYDPQKGKTYKCRMWLEDDDSAEGGKVLKIRGYIGISVLGRSTTWTRVPWRDIEAASDGE